MGDGAGSCSACAVLQTLDLEARLHALGCELDRHTVVLSATRLDSVACVAAVKAEQRQGNLLPCAAALHL